MTLSRIVFASILLAAIAVAQNAPVVKPPALVRSAAVRKQLKPVASKDARKAEESTRTRRRRDPFVSMIRAPRPAKGNHAAPVCTTGKKCLVIGQMILKGIAQGPDGRLALVENSQRKSYFLREKDPVFNGEVVRINRDSVVFQQRAAEKSGRVARHEVVMKLSLTKPA